MAFKSWYATVVTLPNGEHVVLGGRSVRSFAGTSTIPAIEAEYSPTPEVRAGAVTHAFNNEQRFFDLPISQTDNIVTVRSPASANVAPPGFYLLFVWNAAGIPSVAKFVHIS